MVETWGESSGYIPPSRFLFDDNGTGRFKIRRVGGGVGKSTLTIFSIEQEIEEKYLFVYTRKKWIPLQETTHSLITTGSVTLLEATKDINVWSYSEDSIKERYTKVLEDYKPILREKRLKQLLD